MITITIADVSALTDDERARLAAFFGIQTSTGLQFRVTNDSITPQTSDHMKEAMKRDHKVIDPADMPDAVAPLALATRFHETYERLAPAFGYETRPDTKVFDPTSKNGRLMVAVCAALTGVQIQQTIDPADMPDTGAPPKPPVPDAPMPPVAGIDPAAIFGGADAPIPPAPPTPTPPVPPAAPDASSPGSAPAPTAAARPDGVDLDIKGLPWDARIHSGAKKKNDDGAWSKRRNTPDDVIKTVEAELRTLMGTTPVVPQPPAPPVPIDGGVPQPPAPPGHVPDASAPPVPPATVVMEFQPFMSWVSGMVADKKFTKEQVADVIKPLGLSTVVGLNSRPDLIPQVHATLAALAVVQ